MNDTIDRSRRSTLRSIAALGTVGGLSTAIGSASAQPDPPGEGPDEPEEGSETHSQRLTKKNSVNEKQFDAYVKRKRNQYGDDLVGTIKPSGRSADEREVSVLSGAPETTNLSFVRAWPAQSYKIVANKTNAVLARADHSLALYRSPQTDPDGKNVYYFWHWSQSNAESKWWYTGRTTFMRNRINLLNSREQLTNFRPNQALTVNGRTYPITISASYKGVTVSIGSSYTLRHGEVFPESGQVQLGNAGKFSVAFAGCARDVTVGMNAVTEVRSTRSIPTGGIAWDTRVKANTTCIPI